MIKKQNTIKRLIPKSSDTKFLGSEPEWDSQPEENRRISAMANAFNWYNYHYGKKDAKDMIVHYLEFNDRTKDAKTIRGIPDSQVRVTIGWVCRMSLMGLILNDHEKSIVNDEINVLLKVKQEIKHVVTEGEQAQAKLTIQDHLREKVSECAGELEGMYDDFIVAGTKTTADFKPLSLMRGMNIAPQMINKIKTVWELRLAELQEVLTGKDPFLVEGYSHLTKPQLKNCVKFCETVINDCHSYVQVKKVERKPRAKKAVSPEKTSANFKYLKEFADLKLKSESPAKLVGASEAWLYDTVRRKLIHVMADVHAQSFTVKGSSIIAFDKNTSVQKTLRKPAEQLKAIMSVGKPAARKEFSAIKATETAFNGRGNPNVIILKAW